jgi:hypothetical protein
MLKEKNQIDLLWQFTHPIDSWIIEHISFSKNAWGQRIQIGSCIVHIHENAEDYDAIRYDRAAGKTGNEDDKDALFIIYFYAEYALFALYDHREGNKIQLNYEDPSMFAKLESMIWNARTVDYIYADLNAMEENLRLIRDTMWYKPEKMVNKSIHHLGSIFELVSQLDAHVRRTTRLFVRDENIAHSYNTRESRQQELIEPYEAPF